MKSNATVQGTTTPSTTTSSNTFAHFMFEFHATLTEKGYITICPIMQPWGLARPLARTLRQNLPNDANGGQRDKNKSVQHTHIYIDNPSCTLNGLRREDLGSNGARLGILHEEQRTEIRSTFTAPRSNEFNRRDVENTAGDFV